MSKERTLVYKNRFPEKTWSLSLKRFKGKVREVRIFDRAGNPLRFSDRIIGDRLVVLLAGPPASGELRISLTGEKYHYFYVQDSWEKFKTLLGRIFRSEYGQANQISA